MRAVDAGRQERERKTELSLLGSRSTFPMEISLSRASLRAESIYFGGTERRADKERERERGGENRATRKARQGFFFSRHENSASLVKRACERARTRVSCIRRALSALLNRGTVFPIAFVRRFHCLLLYRTPYESMRVFA